MSPSSAAPQVRIALLSGMILVLELAFIRQVPAEVRAISYFTNLMFTAGFSGMGLGCILQRQRSFAPALPLGLLLVFGFILLGRGIVIHADAVVAEREITDEQGIVHRYDEVLAGEAMELDLGDL